MKIVPVKPEDVPVAFRPYRYDINFDEWVQDADSTVYLRPTKLLVPASLRAECLKILNNEFDKSYELYVRRNR